MRIIRTSLASVALAVTLGVTGAVTLASVSAASAQTATSTTVRMATNANAVTTSGSPVNRTGTWVFFGVCGAIGGVATVLFINHRRSKRS